MVRSFCTCNSVSSQNSQRQQRPRAVDDTESLAAPSKWPRQAAMRTQARSRTLEATALHEAVPPDRWCVTCLDLKYLRREVQQAIWEGNIYPPQDGSDDFDSQHGPSIYTVNEQHIKPVTHAAGKMSWALMRNPQGLDCDARFLQTTSIEAFWVSKARGSQQKGHRDSGRKL